MLTLEELKKLDPDKLKAALLKAKEESFKVKFEVRSGQSKNIHHIEKYKKLIAQIKTLLNEKNIT